jgi:hypothetical protein
VHFGGALGPGGGLGNSLRPGAEGQRGSSWRAQVHIKGRPVQTETFSPVGQMVVRCGGGTVPSVEMAVSTGGAAARPGGQPA